MISQETARAILKAQDHLKYVEILIRMDSTDPRLCITDNYLKGPPFSISLNPETFRLALDNELALARKALEDANARAKEELA